MNAADLDALLATAKTAPRGGGDWFARLSPEVQAVVQKHLDRDRDEVSDKALAEKLTEGGIRVSMGMVQSHRSKGCSCYRTS